jgi:hypothetical protein
MAFVPGLPGYPVATSTPTSSAARATASSPVKKSRLPVAVSTFTSDSSSLPGTYKYDWVPKKRTIDSLFTESVWYTFAVCQQNYLTIK